MPIRSDLMIEKSTNNENTLFFNLICSDFW